MLLSPTKLHTPLCRDKGGESAAALKRLGRWGHGFMASGGGDPKLANALFRQVEAIWQNTGRSGKLRLVACTYFGLGEQLKVG